MVKYKINECQWLYYNYSLKRYFIIDLKIAQYFVQCSESLSNPFPFYATQIINPFLIARISANHDKE